MSKLVLMFVSILLEASYTPVTDTLPMKGTYTLIIFLSKQIRIKVGQLGLRSFPRGYYTYTGSALGTGASSLTRRVSRHLRKTGKKKHWHIDFLLAHRDTSVTVVVAAWTKKRRECELNCYIKTHGAARIPVSGFGSSDCNGNCQSHLFYFGEEDVKKKIGQLYADKLGFRPITIGFCNE